MKEFEKQNSSDLQNFEVKNDTLQHESKECLNRQPSNNYYINLQVQYVCNSNYIGFLQQMVLKTADWKNNFQFKKTSLKYG